MAKERDGFPLRIRDLLGGASERLGVDRPVETGRVWARWESIVGAQIADHAEPISLRSGTLKIRASSPAWATELGYLVEQIKTAVNAEIGRPLVDEVVVVTGKGAASRPRRSGPPQTAKPPTEQAPSAPLPESAGEALERAHKAWLKRHSRGRSEASEKPKNPW